MHDGSPRAPNASGRLRAGLDAVDLACLLLIARGRRRVYVWVAAPAGGPNLGPTGIDQTR